MGSGAALPLPDALTATLAALRCDCAAFAGAGLPAARLAGGMAIDFSANASAALVAGAIAAANEATVCAPAAAPAISRRRRELLLQRAAAGLDAPLRRARHVQQVPSLPWANFSINLAVGAANVAATAAAAAATTVASFPLSTAAWAPVWSYTPAAWVANVGSAFTLTPGSIAVVYNSATPEPTLVEPASGALSGEQQLGLGLGLGLSLCLTLAAAAIALLASCARTPTRATSRLHVARPLRLGAVSLAAASKSPPLSARP